MTREEAQNELSELEPREADAWAATERKRQELDDFRAAWQIQFNSLNDTWQPLYSRKRLLQSFLEISG